MVLESASENAKYTSPMIQKGLLNIIANNITKKINEKVGNAKFCILLIRRFINLIRNKCLSFLDLSIAVGLFENISLK